MRKALYAVAVLLLLVACERGSKPNPKPRKTHVVSYGAYVKICLTPAHMLRVSDIHCEAVEEGYAWIWVKDSSIFPEELPAVSERLQAARGEWYAPQSGALVESLPEAGGYFTRTPPLWVTPSATP